MRPFDLLRYFTAASLAVILLLALLTAAVFSRNLERNLADEAGLYAQDLGRSINRALFEEFLVPLAANGGEIDLSDPEQLHTVDRIVSARTEGFRILDVILFDPTSTVIYSTHADDIGYRSVDNAGIAAALATRASTFLKRAELERDEPSRPGHALIETYMPFYDLDPASDAAPIIGVLEIYQDGRPIAARISRGQRQIAVATAALMALLFVALFAIVQRGDLRIRQLTSELEDSNRALERRVELRTREIEAGRARLESLFNGIADGITVIDREFRISAFNNGIQQLFGSPETRDHSHCYARYAGRGSPCPECPALYTFRTHRTGMHGYRWADASGAERAVEVTTFPFADPGGDPRVIEVIRDVSERATLERQILQSESLASLGRMAAGVAHEIRNPVGMISSSAQLLAKADGLSERERELLQVIRDESERISGTISEFVHFARPPEPSRSATDVGWLMERVRSMLRPEAERRELPFDIELEPGLPKIVVDPEMIYRALTNLCLNAIQVQEHGGFVKLGGQRNQGGVTLTVTDGGPGIAQEDLEHVFEPFVSRRAGGTGLGLSIVQRIVAENGGSIEVESSPSGTCFTLRFSEEAA